MKRLSETEDDLVLEIPAVVGIRPVRVQPLPVLIVLDIKHVRVAVRVSICAHIRPRHHPLSTLGIESDLPLKWLKMHAPSSFVF